MADQVEIEDMFQSKLNILDQKELYSDFQYIYANDTNSGSYASGQVNFNLSTLGDKFTILRDSYLEIPMTVACNSGGTTFSAATHLAVKNSLLSLIFGLQITTTDGQVIVNEQTGATPIIQNLKLFLDSNYDWINSLSQSIHYQGKDMNTSVGGSIGVNTVSPDITTAISTTDYTTNYPLANRISCLQTQCAAAGAVAGAGGFFSFIATIPLRLVHSIFDQFSFPMVNYPLLLTFNISSIGGNQYQPFTIGTAAANVQLSTTTPTVVPAVTASATTWPMVTINTAVSERGYAPGACRIKLKQVKFHSETAKRVKAQMEKGFKRTIQYTVSDFYKPITNMTYSTANTAVGINQLITNSAIRPVRLWALPVPTGNTALSVAGCANTFPGSIGPYWLNQCNIQVNGENFYLNNLQSQMDFYKIFETMMVGSGESSTSGAEISYIDWLWGLNPYCFDLSRIKQLDVNNPTQLSITTNVFSAGTGAFDVLFIVERLMTLIMDVKSSSITSAVKAVSYNSE
jgi:hypothetical protein